MDQDEGNPPIPCILIAATPTFPRLQSACTCPAVCARLGVTIINARTPQAKGRGERVFRTLQQRLVPEVRRHGITTLDEANEYRKTVYLRHHNDRFAVAAASDADAHVPVHPSYDMDTTLGRYCLRVVHLDWTIRYNSRVYQIPKRTAMPIYPRTRVTCVEFLDGSVHAYHRGAELPLKEANRR